MRTHQQLDKKWCIQTQKTYRIPNRKYWKSFSFTSNCLLEYGFIDQHHVPLGSLHQAVPGLWSYNMGRKG